MRSIALLLLLIPAVSSVAATTYTITRGTADLTVNSGLADESFSIAGPGFSFTGSGAVSGYPCRVFEPCPLGAQFPAALTELSSEDTGVSGTITIGNTSSDYDETPGLLGGADIRYDFNLSTPATNPPNSLILKGPFTATADFGDPDITSFNVFSFTGSGTVTINLNWAVYPPEFAPSGYELQSIHFAFASVPEPGTGILVLAAISLVGILHFRKKLRH
jgi:PEP-CTERM motif